MSREKDSGETKGFDPRENIGLVNYFVTRFIARNPGFLYLKEEIRASCLEGLVKASKVYDPNKGAISSLCWRYFQTETERCIANAATAVKSNRNHGLVLCRSLEKEDAGERLKNIVSKLGSVDPKDPTIVIDIKKMLSVLPVRTSKVLTLTYGLFNNKKHTLQEVGDIMSLTRERIRQLRNEGIEELNKKYATDFNRI